MSKICQITGKKAFGATKKFYWVEQDMWISLTISAAGLRTINKLGLNAAMTQAYEKGYLQAGDIRPVGF